MKNWLFKERPFWQQFLLIIAIDVVIVFVLSLFLGFDIATNLFFISSILCLIVAVVPIFGDIGSSAKALRKTKKEGVMAKNEAQEKFAESEQGARITYLFGLAGILLFIASILTTPQGL